MTSSDKPYNGPEVANPCRPRVVPEWTDYNDHFNVAYYARAFDMAAQAFRSEAGASTTPPFRTQKSRIDYLQEIPGGTVLALTSQVISAGPDGLHLLQALYAGETRYLAAIEERMEVPYDPDNGAVTTLDEAGFRGFADVAERHSGLPIPDGWGGLKQAAA